MGWTRSAAGVLMAAVMVGGAQAQGKRQPMCSRVTFEGDVKAGEVFEKVFAKGLKFYLEPLRSGWIVRVLDADGARGPHDYAELATPPYRSVSPLLISTDWSFRAQDAVGWNPRRFRYAGNKAIFQRLADLYPAVMKNDAASSGQAAALVMNQPEGVLEILDARIVPGLADQARMAATVASHFGSTPHTVDQAVAPSPLGSLEEIRFRVQVTVATGQSVPATQASGLKLEKINCSVAPTTSAASASQQRNK